LALDHSLQGSKYCLYAPSARLALAGRGMSTTPKNANLFFDRPPQERALKESGGKSQEKSAVAVE